MMTVDPKYAHLPGIAFDQPDVYETHDLPESDQAQQEAETFENEAIETANVNAEEAFKAFKGKQLNASGVDFSDRLSGGGRTGYNVEPSEYELGVPVKDETPLQRYQRLQNEVSELLDTVTKLKAEKPSDGKETNVSVEQVQALSGQLTHLQLENVLGTEALAHSMDPTGQGQKALMDQISKLKETVSAKPSRSSSAKPAKSGEDVTYEVFCHGDQDAYTYNNKIANLVQRLQRLESVVGETSDKSRFSGDLVTCLETLEAKMALLDRAQLDQLDGRLQATNQKLNLIAEKKSVIEDADKHAKISELYDLVKRWDTTCTSLPDIKDRLLALKTLHEQALQFSAALSHLDTTQQETRTQLQEQNSSLNQVETKLQSNLDTLMKSCANIDKRLSALKK